MKKENPNKAKARELAKRISEMTEEQKAMWLARVPILTMDGKPISGKNHMLAAMQCEAATMLGGFRQWLAAGRVVREGQSAIYIFAPRGRGKSDGAAPGADGDAAEGDAGGDSLRFIMVPVFDVSQTVELPAEQPAAA